jgi:hypothetical protein
MQISWARLLHIFAGVQVAAAFSALAGCYCCLLLTAVAVVALVAGRNAALSGITHDIHSDIKEDEKVQEMHDDAEKFDPRTEEVFKVSCHSCVSIYK